MSTVANDNGYRSPVRKLMRFFERSRDTWKRKCQEAKALVKRLTNGMRALQRSRDRWKALAQQRQEELRRLRRELDGQKKRS